MLNCQFVLNHEFVHVFSPLYGVYVHNKFIAAVLFILLDFCYDYFLTCIQNIIVYFCIIIIVHSVLLFKLAESLAKIRELFLSFGKILLQNNINIL